jgi:hypothetical protein
MGVIMQDKMEEYGLEGDIWNVVQHGRPKKF